MPLTTATACRILAWETAVFQARMARADVDSMVPAQLCDMMEWCRREAVRCLCCLVPVEAVETIRLLEAQGFYFVDLRLTLERSLADEPSSCQVSPAVIRLARSQDVPALRAIAAGSHVDGRFYHDPEVASGRASEFYAEWIEQSCGGTADAVLVADAGEPVGYLTLHREPEGAGRIGLFAVHRAVQGQGIGASLLQAGFAWCVSQGLERVWIVTQGRNLSAQRLYHQQRFRPYAAHLWYHKWW
jgi:TDP-D-fucosamine acetyltransferase